MGSDMQPLADYLIAKAAEVHDRLCKERGIDPVEADMLTALAEDLTHCTGLTYETACPVADRIWDEARHVTDDFAALTAIITRHAGTGPDDSAHLATLLEGGADAWRGP